MTLEAFKNLMILYCMDIPDDCKYAAVDETGALHGYYDKPDTWRLRDQWSAGNGSFGAIKYMCMDDINWKDTLIEL